MSIYRDKRKKSREKQRAREAKAKEIKAVKAALASPPPSTLIKPIAPTATVGPALVAPVESKVNESTVKSSILKMAGARKNMMDQAKMAAQRLAEQKAAEAKRREMMELQRTRQAVAEAQNRNDAKRYDVPMRPQKKLSAMLLNVKPVRTKMPQK